MNSIFSAFLALIYSILISVGFVPSNAEKWKLDIPVYEGGIVSKECYLDGSGLLSDWDGPTGFESKMEVVANTDAEEYRAYCEALVSDGFIEVYRNTLGNIECNAFRKDGKLYYTYFSDLINEVRIIEDNGTNSLEDFGYASDEGEGVTVYQFDYPYADYGEHKDEEIYSTNGMMYIIHLADNSLIVIDGGSIRQSSDKNIDECMKLMRKITNTAEGEPIRISLWYGTHGHSDHVTFFYKLIGFYHSEINLERVMFNYPSFSVCEHNERIDMFRNRLTDFYPNVKYLSAHSGISFSIANADFDVLYTHEDSVNAFSGKTPITNPNDGSVVCRITAAGKTLLVTGDMNIIAQTKILNMHKKEMLKCDVLQAPHHLYNAVTFIYDYADAQYVYCPMSKGRGAWLAGTASARLFYKDEQMLYADDALYIITFGKDKIELSSDKTDCVPFDGSSMNTIK